MLLMVLFSMLQWWYTTAWMNELENVSKRARGVLEAFSVGLLAKTLFAPFRQIDAGSVRGPLNIKLRAWFDRTFSRLFGAVVRSIMIVSGCIAAAGIFVAGLTWAALWLVLPVLPLVGAIMMAVM